MGLVNSALVSNPVPSRMSGVPKALSKEMGFSEFSVFLVKNITCLSLPTALISEPWE